MKDCRTLILPVAALAAGAATMNAYPQADVALCDLHQVVKWGTLGDITAYSVGTTSVNVGTTNLNWVQFNPNHPVISQNMFRIHDGTIEQIGQSWLKHSFCALQIPSACDSGCNPLGGCLSFLGPGCQDPYSASRNGSQSLLGPKWQVNANSGVFPYPPADGDQGASGDLAYLRLQVHNSDLGDANSIYLVEGQYVALDDATAGNQNNNASYRLVSISAAPNYNIGFIGGQGTQFNRQGIMAWRAHGLGIGVTDPDVILKFIQDPSDGLFIVGYKASDNGDGTWHYEYAVENMNHDGSAGSFSVPVGSGATITNIGFHDVDYHSGDGPGAVNFDGTDWAATVGAGSISWTTESWADNPNANALRWATMYNFRFDADSPPQDVVATIGVFKPSPTTTLSVDVVGPSEVSSPCPYDCAAPPDGTVGILDFLELLAQWSQTGTSCDAAGDGVDIIDFLDQLAAWGPCP